MFKKMLLVTAIFACTAQAQVEVPISGNVASKCVITTDTPGVYGNPVSNKLSTLPQDGGVLPIVRYDIIEGDSYKARLSYPIEFTTSPALNDVVSFDGEIEIHEVSDAQMSAWEATREVWDNTRQYDLSLQGSIWFKIQSIAEYGFDKSFPGGQYRAAVIAECIAK